MKTSRAKLSKLDPNTWGDSPSAIILTEILNRLGDRKLVYEVGKICHQTNVLFKDVLYCEFKAKLLVLIREEAKRKVASKDWPNKVKTYTLNYIATRHKQYLNDENKDE